MNNKTATHTSGPWTTPDGVEIHSSCGKYIGEVICWAKGVPFTAETEANARLMASAPDLLAALTELHDWVDRNVNHAGATIPVGVARAAISKAKGL